MRTIKFRGRGKSGKWHYGDLMQYDDGAICIGEHSQIGQMMHYHNSDYKAIAQRATEIKDPVLDALMIRMNMYEVYHRDCEEILKRLKTKYNNKVRKH